VLRLKSKHQYVAEFEGLVKKFHKNSNIAQLQPELSMMMLRRGMNSKVLKQVVQKFESQQGSAGQNMTWTNARPIFTALRAESSGKAKHGGPVAIP
jgi:hypothetical protein